MKLFTYFTLTILGAIFAVAYAHASAPYCPGKTVDPYSYICTSTQAVKKGQDITFTLYQSRTPLFIGPGEHPWNIEDSNGNVVYQPASTAPQSQPAPTFSFSDSWNQTDTSGKKVKKGTYFIVFPTMPYVISPLPITIGK